MNGFDDKTSRTLLGERSKLRNQPRTVRESMHAENMRIFITCFVVALYISWVIISFITFVYTGNSLFLLGFSAFAYPLHKVIDYYFAKPIRDKH